MRQPLFEHRLTLAGYETRALELEGEGPPIVLLHGFMDSADTWRRTLDLLARADRAALALDLPGFATADDLHEGAVLPQLDAFAAAAVRHAAQDHGGEVILAGNSLGGAATLRAAEREDLPLAGIVPVAPAGLDMPSWFAAVEGDPVVQALLRLPMPGAVVQRLVGESYRRLAFAEPGRAPQGAVRSFASHFDDRASISRGLATGRRMLPELRYPFHFGAVQVPALLIWGDRDRMVSHTGAARLLDALPGTRYELLQDVGHCPQVEAAELFAQLLLGFDPDREREALPRTA